MASKFTKDEADAFAQYLSEKVQLSAEEIDFSFLGSPNVELDELVVFRSRACKKLVKNLDEIKATGNDNISAVILKRLASCIAIPFTIV